jgi:hypothetical protein
VRQQQTAKRKTRRGHVRRAGASAQDADGNIFDPGTALEEMHGTMLRIEALSQATVNTLEFWPHPQRPSARRRRGRTYDLVLLLDKEIAEAVTMGDRMLTQLSNYLKSASRRE